MYNILKMIPGNYLIKGISKCLFFRKETGLLVCKGDIVVNKEVLDTIRRFLATKQLNFIFVEHFRRST